MQTLQQFSRAADPQHLIDAIGGERLAGSGFEDEEAELAFAEAED